MFNFLKRVYTIHLDIFSEPRKVIGTVVPRSTLVLQLPLVEKIRLKHSLKI